MKIYQRRTLAKIAIFVPLSLVATFVAIGVLNIVSTTDTSRVGAHSLLSYWASIPAAILVLLFSKRPSKSLAALASALLFPIMVNIGSAISYLTNLIAPPVVKDLPNLVTDIYEYTVFGVFILVALLLRLRSSEEEGLTTGKGFAFGFISVFLPGALYGFMWFYIIPFMTPEILLYFGASTAITGIIITLVAVYLLVKHGYSEISVDIGYFASACILSAAAIGVLFVELFLPSSFWIYAETIQMASYFLITIAICVPFLRKVGFSRSTAYVIVLALAVLSYMPFTITIGIEAARLHVILEQYNTLAFSIIHIGVGSLSIMMGFLLFAYSRRRPSRNLYALIMLFVLWAEVAAVTVFTVFPLDITLRGEPIVAYLVGSILSIPLLYLAIRWTPKNQHIEATPPSAWLLLAGSIILLGAVLAGEIGNQFVLQRYIWLEGSPVSNSLLLLTNLLLIFLITYLLFAQAELSGGQTSIEVYVVLFLSMWIVPNVLKSYYEIWTSGWWVSEVLILLALMIGPAFLGLLYVRSMRDAEDSHSKATLYADLLMHDISNYHQMLLTAVELLGEEDTTGKQRERLSSDAYHVISLAEQLITNVRLITESEDLSQESLIPLNLMETLVESLDRVMRIAGGKGVKLQLMPFSAQAYVLGSSVLKHVFINIIHGVLLQPLEAQKISVEIRPRSEMGSEFWMIRIFIPSWWMDIESAGSPPRAQEDFSGTALGLLVSRLVTESLGGNLTVLKNMEEPEMGTSFQVLLPAYQKEA
ncbi:MAG: ATP-binding protein [Candidatus Thorarchaeota archaeon]|jgi:signal transduction histidine kinase